MSKSMFVLGLISQKGGPGKSTMGLNLACVAADKGLTSVIIDLDPQATAANWKDRRTLENPAVVSTPPSRLRQALDAAQQHGADFVVIDSPGKADNISIIAATHADLVFVPVEARMSNFETIPGVYGLLQAADSRTRKERGLQNATPTAFVVLNKIHPSARTQVETIKQMVADTFPQIPVCPHHLSQFDLFGTSQDIGKSVFDDDPKSRPAEEIRQLYNFTCAQSDKLGKRK